MKLFIEYSKSSYFVILIYVLFWNLIFFNLVNWCTLIVFNMEYMCMEGIGEVLRDNSLYIRIFSIAKTDRMWIY